MARKNLLATGIILLVLSAGGVAIAGESIIVSLSAPDCPWADSRLSEKLNYHLSSINRVPIIRRELPDGSDLLNFEDLLSWGREQGARFIVDLSVDRIDLEKRKMTIIPELIFRYRVYAVLSGTMRIIDLKKRRLVKMKDLEFEKKASGRWQLLEDDSADPALIIPADEKLILFSRLEDMVAKKLYKEVKNLIRGNRLASR